ncbi:DNA ligase [Solimonas terrae]|uniref:DNA ligase n=1 Tax=Solimonas terrae TaxID=1396819 RepID=A0A6M2BSL4_9GAMM|nr:DNA ligase [Solimonas terrae]NGY05478.1 DNA ligase [Solimonas terrae]
MLRRFRIAMFLIGALPALAVHAADPPPLMLADVYHVGDAIDLSAYWVSEKFDGVRGYWDGRRLWTRGGTPVSAPAWFTTGWPAVPLDGELWAGRGRFEQASSTVRSETPDDAAWRQMHLMVFDLPAHGGSFDTRLAALRALFSSAMPATLRLVEQTHVASPAALLARRDAIVAAGGEGLVLHRGASFYRAERNDDLLKFKPHDDAEARVVGYTPGKGKYTGMVGALEVERADGLRFRIGSGLSDADRRTPPPVGTTITYTYNGLTANGVPRFARYLRVRTDLP